MDSNGEPPYHPMKAPSITSPKKQIPSSQAMLRVSTWWRKAQKVT
mgnify:CR=1 FL=1